MDRFATDSLKYWWGQKSRKPLVLRGARQVGKSFLVREFCKKLGLECLEINFEKEPSLRRLFPEGENSKTVSLLEAYFRTRINPQTLLFLDEIQAAPEVFARLRYFYEETQAVPVIAAGSLLEFALEEMTYSVPVGRIEYLHLGPMRFEEFLTALGKKELLALIQNWDPKRSQTDIPEIFHEHLLEDVRDFSLVGGMPEAVARFIQGKDFLGCESAQRSILETYRQDFAKFRKRIPLERLERVFLAIPSQVGKKWVHARVSPHEKAQSTEAALEALCKARVAHKVYHSSGNGIPLAAEKKDTLFKTLFLDVGLMGIQLGLRITDFKTSGDFARINEGTIAEQWIGQHLLDLRSSSQAPEIYYWVREKTGSTAEVDFLIPNGSRVIPVEVKAGPSTRAKSLQVFLNEKTKSNFGIHFSTNQAKYDPSRKTLNLPFYMVDQIPRLASLLL